ncbi:hypothetical protein O0L34_g14036 [Tuta absoluta]|nr:hypothetical protein O0L34_g14036 [Tuta absoluta]
MSYPGYPYGPSGGPPPPYGHYYPPPHSYPPQDPPSSSNPPPPMGYYMPAMMVPMPLPAMPVPMPQPPQEQPGNPTYITNYYYNETSGSGLSGNAPPAIEPQPQVAELAGEYDWIPTTATTAAVTLTGKAVVGGHEGWDGSQLWVIRAWHNGDLIPGKFSVRHNAASIMYDGKEIHVQNIEVLIARPESLKWVPASNGAVPPGAIAGGRTASGETLYVGRARYQLSVTPGKVHPSHNSCYIAFGGNEVAHKLYDVLCRV